MQLGKKTSFLRFLIFPIALLCALNLPGCGKGCSPRNSGNAAVQSIRKANFSSGPLGFLVVPNPIDATRNIQASAASVANALQPFRLPGLSSNSILQNDYLRVRIKKYDEGTSGLAKPNSEGKFSFRPDEAGYREVMAYQSLYTLIEYVESLGFQLPKSRPLFAMVEAESNDPNEVNAIYDENRFNTNLPFTIRLYGKDTARDRNMFYHEGGHYIAERLTHKIGFDRWGDEGTKFTYAAGIHEWAGDWSSESLEGDPYIGRWLAKFLDGYSPGEPLRWALDKGDGKSTFRNVAVNDGRGVTPERYLVAEWLTRVTWEIRESFLNEDRSEGATNADRLMYTTISMLKQNATLKQFMESMLSADDELYCGGHSGAIQSAFSKRGFTGEFEGLSSRLVVSADAVPLGSNGDGSFGFQMTIRNPNNAVAHNVRVQLSSSSDRVHVITPAQGLGDLRPGQSITIGGSGGLGLDFSPSAEIDRSAAEGSRHPWKLRIGAENGGIVELQGEVAK